MRRRDCVRNLETPLVCAKRHRQITIKCAYSNVELQCIPTFFFTNRRLILVSVLNSTDHVRLFIDHGIHSLKTLTPVHRSNIIA